MFKYLYFYDFEVQLDEVAQYDEGNETYVLKMSLENKFYPLLFLKDILLYN